MDEQCIYCLTHGLFRKVEKYSFTLSEHSQTVQFTGGQALCIECNIREPSARTFSLVTTIPETTGTRRTDTDRSHESRLPGQAQVCGGLLVWVTVWASLVVQCGDYWYWCRVEVSIGRNWLQLLVVHDAIMKGAILTSKAVWC